MKNVIAKTNKAVAVIFYRDGKRISRAAVQKAIVDDLKWGDVIVAIPRGNKFVVEINGDYHVPYADGDIMENLSECVDFQFTVKVKTVSDGLKVAAAALKHPEIYVATVYDAEEYGKGIDRRRWDIPRGIVVTKGKIRIEEFGGRVCSAYQDELAAQDFQPIREYEAARTKRENLSDEYEAWQDTWRQRRKDAWDAEITALKAKNRAIDESLQSFIA